MDYLKPLSDADLNSIFGVVAVDYKTLNNLKEISQFSVRNVFFIDPTCLKKKIGNIGYADRAIISDIFERYCIWLSNVRAQPGQ